MLEPAEEGGDLATAPFGLEMTTQAENLWEAFLNARDAAEANEESRLKLSKQLTSPGIIADEDTG